MLGLFRQPLQGKLQDGFKSAARRLKKAGWAGSTALSAESKYDPKAKKFAPSEVETILTLTLTLTRTSALTLTLTLTLTR